MRKRLAKMQWPARRHLGAFAAASVSLVALLPSCSENGSRAMLPGADSAARIEISPSPASLVAGSTLQLLAVAQAANGRVVTGKTFAWSSANPAIASVSENGIVTGVTVGSTAIAARSGSASANVTVSVTPAPPGGAPAITVAPTTVYQTMWGWEATAQAGQECALARFPTYRDELMDRTVEELGIDRLRLEMRSGWENSVDWDSQLLSGAISREEWKRHRYEVVNDNADPNAISGAGFQWTSLDSTVVQVVEPLRQRLAARGEKLIVNLTYVDFNHTGFEHRNSPAEYAEFVFAAFQHLRQKFGWVPEVVEIVLEPDNTAWQPAEIAAAIVATGDRLSAAGWHPEFIAPSTSSMAEAVSFFDQIIQVPRVREYLRELAYHRYSAVSSAALHEIATRAVQYGIRTSMLEKLSGGEEELLADLTLGRVSAWQEFALAYCDPNDDGTAYYRVDLSDPLSPRVILGRRAKYLRQFFRYVRFHAVRVGATSTDPDFAAVAFRNTDGKFVVVVRAPNDIPFLVSGLPAGTYGVTYASGGQAGVNPPDVTIAAGASVTVTVPGGGVATIFGR